MTEAEWLASGSTTHLLIPLHGRMSDRKQRLFQCACCRCLWHLMTDERCRQAVEIAERSVDGGVEESEELPFAHVRADTAFQEAIEGHDYDEQERNSRAEVCGVAALATHPEIQIGAVCCAVFEAAHDPMSQERISADLLRDIFGNPFRPVAFSPAWRTDTAIALARTMYEAREFSAMPILADALQDAGCDSDDVLSHCRTPGPHVRGCWVCDLVLGLV